MSEPHGFKEFMGFIRATHSSPESLLPEKTWQARAEAAEARADKLAERVKVLEEAVDEAIDTMRLVETPALPDPIHHSIVKELGLRIGFGALMSTASAGWIETAKEKGYPISGAFVAGPCLGTVQMTLAKLRRARAAIGE